jgi:hypothetical protein
VLLAPLAGLPATRRNASRGVRPRGDRRPRVPGLPRVQGRQGRDGVGCSSRSRQSRPSAPSPFAAITRSVRLSASRRSQCAHCLAAWAFGKRELLVLRVRRRDSDCAPPEEHRADRGRNRTPQKKSTRVRETVAVLATAAGAASVSSRTAAAAPRIWDRRALSPRPLTRQNPRYLPRSRSPPRPAHVGRAEVDAGRRHRSAVPTQFLRATLRSSPAIPRVPSSP